MESFNGWYREWSGAEKQAISLMVLDEYVQIGFIGTSRRIHWDLQGIQLGVSYDRTITDIRHATQPGLLEIEGTFVYERIQLRKERAVLPWHRRPSGKEWIRNGILTVSLLAIGALVYQLVVPSIAEELADTVSVETERQLGDGVYDVLASDFRIDTGRTKLVSDFFAAMQVPSEYSIRIAVVKSDELNAFALPGGRIVVYSALLDSLDASEELAALLAHEFTHVSRSHATRSIFRQLGSHVILGLVFGNMGTVGGVLVENANELRGLTYSRSLEKEADVDGLKLLIERGISAKGFEQLFGRLRSAAPADLPEFMASHPDLDSRIGYIKETSKGAVARPQPALDTIFVKINP
ncbi:MAG: M48 family metallopeptidase [Bacteroidota bacterium]